MSKYRIKYNRKIYPSASKGATLTTTKNSMLEIKRHLKYALSGKPHKAPVFKGKKISVKNGRTIYEWKKIGTYGFNKKGKIINFSKKSKKRKTKSKRRKR